MASGELKQSVAEWNADLVRHVVDPVDATETITRRWDHVDATVAASLVASLSADTVATPKVDGVADAGTWANSVVQSDGESERDVTITQTLKLIRKFTTAANLVALSYLTTRSNTVDLPYNSPPVLGNGKRDVGTHETNTYSFVWRDLDPADEDDFTGLTAANILTAFAGVFTDFVYVDRKWQNMEDNTAQAVLVFVDNNWNPEGSDVETSGNAADSEDGYLAIASAAAVDRQRTSVTRIWAKRTLAAANALIKGNAAADFVWPAAGTSYTHFSNRMSPDGNGSYSVIQVGVVPHITDAWIDGTISFHVDYSVDLRTLSDGVKEEYQQNELRSSIQTFLRSGYGSWPTPDNAAVTNLRGTSYRYHGMGRYSARRVRRA